MFISKARGGYKRDGEQWAQGRFLILMHLEGWPFDEEAENRPMRGIVAYVRMSQCGHFMMGGAKIAGKDVTVSGTYGADGLSINAPKEVYEKGTDVPAALWYMWAKGGGHNGPGFEAEMMRQWGRLLDKRKEG